MSMSHIASAFVASAILLTACGGDDGEPSNSGTPPADVTGTWYGTYINDDVATITGCSGDLTELNGMTLAQIMAENTCSHDEGVMVSQDGNAITFRRKEFTCLDGNYGYIFGSGRVTGNSVEFEAHTVSSYYDFTETDHFHGSVTGPSSLTLYMDRLSTSGSIHGACRISPELRYAVQVEGTETARLAGQGMRLPALVP